MVVPHSLLTTLLCVQEKDEYVENIIADIAALGINYERLTYTSDYFAEMLDLAERLVKAGDLYADDTPVEQMRNVGVGLRAVLLLALDACCELRIVLG